MSSGVGQFIREMRLKRGLSVRDLAARVAMNHSFLFRIETGRRNPPPALLKKLAKALDVRVEELTGRDERTALKHFRELLKADPNLNFEFIRIVNRIRRHEISPKALRGCLSALNGNASA
ncbi:MAG TPA: helix-turn-helix transcriptional regulator [Verrucomicrobiae bacterium]|nr:helix-turn-helix transcriptional regulator [Verrucomicrobiae bacterium]